MSNRIIRNLPDSKYKAVVGNTLAGGSNPFGTESEITDQVTESEIVNGLNVGIKNTNVDAAYIATDGIYRMPTKTECDELINNCTWTWSTQNGVNGYTVEGNGNSIFIPASGYRNGASLLNDGTEGYLWTDTFIDEWAFMVMFSSSQHNTNGSTSRYYGRTIRPVSSIEGVDLGLPSGLKWASVNIGATLPEDYGDYFAWAETETKESFTSENYICPSGSIGTELDPVTHVTKYSLVNILHKNNPNIHTSPEKEARWEGKQDALGFTPENLANKKTTLADNSDTYYPTQKAVKTAVDAKADDSSVVHNTGAETVSGVKTFSNGLINGSLFLGSQITTTTLSGNATWNIDDLKNMMRVVLSGSTNTITLPNGGENTFRFQIIVTQDSTGSRALTISGVSGVNVYNPSEFDFSGGGANQICVCTIIWDGTEYIYECTNYVGGE